MVGRDANVTGRDETLEENRADMEEQSMVGNGKELEVGREGRTVEVGETQNKRQCSNGGNGKACHRQLQCIA